MTKKQDTRSRQQFVAICACGCGEPTLIATESRKGSQVRAGEPLRYLTHHNWRGVTDPELRFWPNVNKASGKFWQGTECWEWTASICYGYGQFGAGNNRVVRAHRYAYESLVGPIPAKLVIDHLCKNTHCVNPAHLEPVTNGVNALRGNGPAAMAARATHCKYGHEYTSKNTHICPRGTRVCRDCYQRRNREAKQRRLAVAA